MKRLYIGIGFLLALLAVGIAVTVAFSRIHGPLAEDLDAAAAAAEAGNWEQADAVLADVRRKWDGCRNFTATVADHEPLEQMDALLCQLEIWGRGRNGEEFTAACASLASMARAMSDSQGITWWSLL